MNVDDIKALLDEQGMTFNELAERMGKERSVVYKTIQNGNPTLSFLTKLSEVLCKPIDEIVHFSQMRSALEHYVGGMPQVDGFVEVDGHIYRVRSKADVQYIMEVIDNNK